MTARYVVKRILALGGHFARQVGSHARYSATYSDAAGNDATCHTTVPMHSGDIPRRTLRSIEKAMEPAFGKGWLR